MERNDKKSILLISDLVGMGNLSTTAMLPILAYMGFPTYNLPTSLVSNNFGYGSYSMLDTTSYLKETFPIWEKLGFRFSSIATGFIPSEEQARVIAQFCQKQAAAGTTIYLDPVMADDGSMYSGLPPATIDTMRKMLNVADLCYPNYTEACYLTGTQYQKGGVSMAEARSLLDGIRSFGAKSVLITSIHVDGKPSVAGYNHQDDSYFALGYDEIPLTFSGTGDVFAAILIGHIMRGENLLRSTQAAMDGVYNFIRLNKDADDPYKGLPIEKYLSIL